MSGPTCDLPADAGDQRIASRAWVPVLGLDLVVVVVFAFLGRVAHEEGNLVLGTVGTAAPFAIGLLAGWLRAPCAGMSAAGRVHTVRFGWWLLLWTMLGGVLLRWLAGEGLAPAFLLVAVTVLGAGLVGRRWVAGTMHRRRAIPGTAGSVHAE